MRPEGRAPSTLDRGARRYSKDAFGVRVEANFLHVQRKFQLHVVLRIELDMPSVSLKRHLTCGFGKAQRVRAFAEVSKGSLEFGYTFSEKARLASRAELDGMFSAMNR